MKKARESNPKNQKHNSLSANAEKLSKENENSNKQFLKADTTQEIADIDCMSIYVLSSNQYIE